MSKRLDAIDNRELWALTASEQARVLLHETRAAGKVARGKSPGRGSAAADQVWTDAAVRVTAEEAVTANARAKKIAAKATEKAERKAARKGWF